MKVTSILIFLLIYSISFAQELQKTSEPVNKLLSERNVLLSKKKSTREVDLKLFQEGYLPPAFVTVEKTSSGNNVYFEIFRDYSKSRTSNMEPRLKAMFPNLGTCKLDFAKQTCEFTFSPAANNEDIDKLVKVFSYNGYTSKK